MLKNIQKTCKKVLTKAKGCAIMSKPSRKGGTQSNDESKNFKKTKKSLKKVLTNRKGCDIITKLTARAESTTVLEN